jgi:hypothetical protein
MVARLAHNQEIIGSNPVPATKTMFSVFDILVLVLEVILKPLKYLKAKLNKK